jgi:hypothetical protein
MIAPRDSRDLLVGQQRPQARHQLGLLGVEVGQGGPGQAVERPVELEAPAARHCGVLLGRDGGQLGLDPVEQPVHLVVLGVQRLGAARDQLCERRMDQIALVRGVRPQEQVEPVPGRVQLLHRGRIAVVRGPGPYAEVEQTLAQNLVDQGVEVVSFHVALLSPVHLVLPAADGVHR